LCSGHISQILRYPSSTCSAPHNINIHLWPPPLTPPSLYIWHLSSSSIIFVSKNAHYEIYFYPRYRFKCGSHSPQRRSCRPRAPPSPSNIRRSNSHRHRIHKQHKQRQCLLIRRQRACDRDPRHSRTIRIPLNLPCHCLQHREEPMRRHDSNSTLFRIPCLWIVCLVVLLRQ
jgi:hypothetical protein